MAHWLIQLQSLAALNNAELCELVCGAQGTKGRFSTAGYWSSNHKIADYYPNFVTLSSDLDTEQLIKEIKDYSDTSRAWTVKDSFKNLDLKAINLEVLFDATWIEAPVITSVIPKIEWSTVKNDSELMAWENAWGGKWTELSERLFNPLLLRNPSINFMASYENNKVIAGAIINKSKEVIGFSNIFLPENNEDEYWLSLVYTIRTMHPDIPFVGYERGQDLAQALRLGSKPIGDLRVWVKRS